MACCPSCRQPRTLRVIEDLVKFSQGVREDKIQYVPFRTTVWNPNSQYGDYIHIQLILLIHICVSTCLRCEQRWKTSCPTSQVSEPLVHSQRLSQPCPDRPESKRYRLTGTTKLLLNLFLKQKSWVFHLRTNINQYQAQLHFRIIDLPNSWVLKTNPPEEKKKSGSAYYLPHLWHKHVLFFFIEQISSFI